MSKFSYKPEDANPIVPDGEYEAVVFGAKAAETKKGDPKLEVVTKVYGGSGTDPLVTDHIVQPYGIRRLKQLCEATGVNFVGGEVDPAEFVGQNVRVRVRVRVDESSQYDDQNVITAYLPDKTSTAETVIRSTTTDSEPSPADESPGSRLGQIGKADAWKGFCEGVRSDRPDVKEDLLIKSFTEVCKAVGKPEAEFTEADWIKIRDEGPKEFVPF